MSTFLTVLSHDHADYLHLLGALEIQIDIAANGGRPSLHVMKGVIGYFKEYSRLFHHPREEMLFQLLSRRAPDLSVKVNGVVEEHRHLRDRLAELDGEITGAAASAPGRHHGLVVLATTFIATERAHIAEENRHLIPAAIHYLSTAEWEWADSSLSDLKDPIAGQAAISPLAQMRKNIFATDQQVHSRRI